MAIFRPQGILGNVVRLSAQGRKVAIEAEELHQSVPPSVSSTVEVAEIPAAQSLPEEKKWKTPACPRVTVSGDAVLNIRHVTD